jgi:CubicO group peptidase (beta-lactamase class C family)
MSGPRPVSEAGIRAIEAVARSHLERGWQSAAQLAVYRDGILQLDLRMGDIAPGRPMDRDARMLWFSATKPVTAVCVLMLAEGGWLDLDTPIAHLWPDFARGGKAACTPRHVLTHQGGFPVFPRDFDWKYIGDWEAVTSATAAIDAAWEPGTAVGYHPVTYGIVLGELIRRVDGREPGDFLHDELFAPLGMRASLGTNDVDAVVPVKAMSEVTFDDPEGSEGRTTEMAARFNARATLRAQLPAANGIGTAEALARFYAMLERGGEIEGVRILRQETVRDATHVHVQTERDRTTGYPAAYGLGFIVGGYAPLDQPGAFGHFGQQCTVGWADPHRGIAAAYLTNGLHEPAIVALRNAEVGAAIVAACEEADR